MDFGSILFRVATVSFLIGYTSMIFGHHIISLGGMTITMIMFLLSVLAFTRFEKPTDMRFGVSDEEVEDFLLAIDDLVDRVKHVENRFEKNRKIAWETVEAMSFDKIVVQEFLKKIKG